ncbi:MAG: HAD family hydrolase [Bacteroidetes bacterium]|nr:HAD family hydrolase [Bacteroidota bacterium]MCL5027083.1 HAD family hydrolase [Chloroflexota bacterium]
MVRAVFLDLYNTICYFDPSREERQQLACRAGGFEVSVTALQRAYTRGEDYWTVENARRSIARLPDADRLAFYAQYEQYLLQQAGLETSIEQAAEIYAGYLSYPRCLKLYDDVLPVLAQLRGRGLKIGLISNNDRPVDAICDELCLTPHLDVALSSIVVGYEKPDPRIFEVALTHLGVRGPEAMHVGDQYHSDIVGAQAVGITPVLIDRSGLQCCPPGCGRIENLWQLLELLCTSP